jgi:hypothetical protein
MPKIVEEDEEAKGEAGSALDEPWGVTLAVT